MSQLKDLLKKIEDRNYTVGIIGLGYVGLPLMRTFHQNHIPVLGFDIDEKKVHNLKTGSPYIMHLGTVIMKNSKFNIKYGFNFLTTTSHPESTLEGSAKADWP